MNRNCLKNLICPQCGYEEKILISTQRWTALTDDGTDDDDRIVDGRREVEYDESTKAECPVCNYQGFLGDFDFELNPDARDTYEKKHGPFPRPARWTPELEEKAYRFMCEESGLTPETDDAYTKILRSAFDSLEEDSDASVPWNDLNFDLETFRRALVALEEFQKKHLA